MKVYRKKDLVSNAWSVGAKDLECFENGKSKVILFFMFFLR